MPTTPLRNSPSFTRAARLDIPFSAFIEILFLPGSTKRSGMAGPEALTSGRKAKPRHRKYLGQTWAGRRRRRASRARLTRAGLQLRWFEAVDHWSKQDKSHLQSSCLCIPRDRLPRDMKSNTFDTRRRHAADRQEPLPCRAAAVGRRERRAPPMTESHSRAYRSVAG